MKVEGGCHCGLVRFEAEVGEEPLAILDCNCSICSMTSYLHLIIPETRFRLLEGQRETTTYRFGTGRARHIFCTQCGIKSFYRPRSHPEGISISLRCVDGWEDLKVDIVPFEGRDWGRGESVPGA